jgi:hypothetical protein
MPDKIPSEKEVYLVRRNRADRFDTGAMSPAFPLNADTISPMFYTLPTWTCVLAFLIILSATFATEFNKLRSFPEVNTLFPTRNASRTRPLVITLDTYQVYIYINIPIRNHNTDLPSCYLDDNSGKPVLHDLVLSDVHRGGPIREEDLLAELCEYGLQCTLPAPLGT